jgi:hypothetical protein
MQPREKQTNRVQFAGRLEEKTEKVPESSSRETFEIFEGALGVIQLQRQRRVADCSRLHGQTTGKTPHHQQHIKAIFFRAGKQPLSRTFLKQSQRAKMD